MGKNPAANELTADIADLIRAVVRECLNQAGGPVRAAWPKDRAMLLNSAESAKMLGISERTLWELKRSGELAYVRMGNGARKESIRYAVEDLKALIAKRKTRGNDNDNSPDS